MIRVKVKIAQSCSTLCYTMDCSPPDFSVHEILQAKILNILRTMAAIHSTGDLLNPRIKPGNPALQADFLPSEPPGEPL